jgi:ABC-type multidrug transport system permease subunit
MYSLLPLQKGIFRIALQANDTFGSKMPVYIVPVGITFGHFFRVRSSLLVQIGKPMNVTHFLKERSTWSAPQQITALRDELSDQLKQIILYIRDDSNYNAILSLSQIYGKEQRQRMKRTGNSLMNRFAAAKETVRNITLLMDSHPQEAQRLLDTAADFSRERKARNISIASVLKPHLLWSLMGKLFFLILGLPYFIFSSIVTAPVTLLSVWIGSKCKDKAFLNALRFLIALPLHPALLLLWGAAIFALFPWVWGVIFILLFIPSFLFVHEYARLARLCISDIRWMSNNNLNKQFQEIKTIKI